MPGASSGRWRDTVSGGGDYAGRPKPAVLIQDDLFDATASITVCLLTCDPTEDPLFRLPIEPNERNGLNTFSRIMVDKVTTVSKAKLGSRVGRLHDEDVVRLNQALLVFLGLALAPRSRSNA
jgi:mRNA interferase MazF